MSLTNNTSDKSDPVKVALYNVIEQFGVERIRKMIADENSADMMNEIITRVQEINPSTNEMGRLLTGLLHYILTMALIPSQRSVLKDRIDVDIVIPDLKSLESDPAKTIVICIPALHDNDIKNQIQLMEKIQPKRDNIWYVTEQQTDKKTYSVRDETIYHIVDDLQEFLKSAGTTKLRLFGEY